MGHAQGDVEHLAVRAAMREPCWCETPQEMIQLSGLALTGAV